MTEPVKTKALIIGTGFSGICMAIKLRQAGISDFLLLEKANDVGGTWRENTYPGAECDIPSALYSYSFEHNAAWQFKWSEQRQILDYQRHVAAKYELYERIRFNEEVVSAAYDQESCRWQVNTANGKLYDCQHLISAVGQLNRPFVPAYQGQSDYRGASFHSAAWDHGVDLAGRQVAVIGNAASALQFIPQIAPQVAELTVYQRSANWVLPKQDRPYKPWEQWLSDKVPLIAKLYRFKLWCRGDGLLYQIMKGNRLASRIATWLSRRNLQRHIIDPVLRRRLTPAYPIGARRILFSDDYYQALSRRNVTLHTDGIARFTAAGIVDQLGREAHYDVIIYGTGFKTNPFLAPMDIRGAGGRRLSEHWSEGAHAYLGITTHGFPNLFMMYGPNTNLGHNSIILMIEAQANYIAECIVQMDKRGWASIQVNKAVEGDYNNKIQQHLAKMVFSAVSSSWYMDAGKITNNWAGTTLEYRRRTRHVDWADFDKQGLV